MGCQSGAEQVMEAPEQIGGIGGGKREARPTSIDHFARPERPEHAPLKKIVFGSDPSLGHRGRPTTRLFVLKQALQHADRRVDTLRVQSLLNALNHESQSSQSNASTKLALANAGCTNDAKKSAPVQCTCWPKKRLAIPASLVDDSSTSAAHRRTAAFHLICRVLPNVARDARISSNQPSTN